MMNLRDYQRAAARTAGQHSDPKLEIMNHSMGLAGETGELIDLLKKDLFHGRPAIQADLESEAGDVLWYLSNLCYALEIDLQRVAENNIKKLRARYPDGFVKGGGIRDVHVAVSPEAVDEVLCEQVFQYGPDTLWISCGEHSSHLGYVWLCPEHYRSTHVVKDNDTLPRSRGVE